MTDNQIDNYNALQKQNIANRRLIKNLQLDKQALKEQLSLYGVGCSFLKQLIDKEVVLKNKLQENLDIYLKIKNMVEYDKTFSQWNKCNLVLWDLKDALYRFGVEID